MRRWDIVAIIQCVGAIGAYDGLFDKFCPGTDAWTMDLDHEEQAEREEGRKRLQQIYDSGFRAGQASRDQ